MGAAERTVRSSVTAGESGAPSQSNLARCFARSEEHTSEFQSRLHLVCRLLLEKKILVRQKGAQARSIKRPVQQAREVGVPVGVLPPVSGPIAWPSVFGSSAQNFAAVRGTLLVP